ncbi:MAG: phosphoserine phosphatase SerB [Thermodesulfobacteriota bacterium]|nr:phosphoserine phosphatase SerB [Thermodesulfobacteriota bacterium]
MTEDKRLLSVTVAGFDQPGLLASLTEILVKHKVDIVDAKQASLDRLLGLYLLLDLNHARTSDEEVIKDLLYQGQQLDLNLSFQPHPETDVKETSPSNLFVVTHFGGTGFLADLARILAEEEVNIENMATVSHHGTRSTEMIINVSKAPKLTRLKGRIMAKSRENNTDLAFQRVQAYRKNKRLIFFDMDSTLVDMEIIDEMARRAHAHRAVARITEKAMRGEFDFEESLIQRVALLKGLSVDALAEIRDNLELSQGVEDLAQALKWLGYKTGIVTGGFDFFADHLRERLGFDYAYSNSLDIENGMLSGRVTGKIVDAAEKARLVNQTACDLGILLDQTVVVGDGANDALMLGQAGLAIAYNAKKALDRVANVSLSKTRLAHILHLLGITEEDLREATQCKTISSVSVL